MTQDDWIDFIEYLTDLSEDEILDRLTIWLLERTDTTDLQAAYCQICGSPFYIINGNKSVCPLCNMAFNPRHE